MDDERFNAIVVGAGLAGSSAAYRMAEAGLSVLLIERGNYAGAKNMTGGRMYTHSLERLMPGFREKAPLERKVVKERIAILANGGGTTIEYRANPEADSYGESYTVLRGPFDQWMAEQAEEAGAMVVTGIQVTSLIREDNRIVGVIAGEEEMYADVVILADGVNSILAEQAGLRARVSPHNVAVGAKDVYELDEDIIEARLGLAEGEGMACLALGDMTGGVMGGGFIYSNRKSLSVGIVAGLADISKSSMTMEEMMNAFATNDVVAPLIKGAKLIERSGHVVPEIGYRGVTTLVADGCLICGDAAGLCINIGYTVRGMDLAIESGIQAADAVIRACASEPFDPAELKSYGERLMSGFVGNDMKLYQHFPEFMENERLFTTYPKFVNDLMADVFAVDGNGAEPLMKKMLKHAKEVGFLNLARDGWKGVRSL